MLCLSVCSFPYCTIRHGSDMKGNAGVLGHFLLHWEGWSGPGTTWANVKFLWNLPQSSIEPAIIYSESSVLPLDHGGPLWHGSEQLCYRYYFKLSALIRYLGRRAHTACVIERDCWLTQNEVKCRCFRSLFLHYEGWIGPGQPGLMRRIF